MTTEQYLEQVIRCEAMIQNKIAERKRIMDLGISTTVPTDRERVQTFGISDLVGKSATDMVSISNQIERLTQKRALIISQIDAMEDLMEYQVLTCYYVRNMNIHEIEDEIDRSESRTWQILRKARKSFENKYGKMYLNVRDHSKSQ